MNRKGQFSIIAALLVAAILIATVMATYAIIRTSPIQVQPQILSTIDETNLALKEILGFTVGYYGSVLQVTGNSSYAKELATNYACSGLENIARMHPEMGASFNLSSVELSAYWYTNCSWSTGRLRVNYNLTGLELYGMTYETSCKLTVQVTELSSNQTELVITKDEDEPLINLGKQNFKFYKYVYGNSTWVLVSPSIEPTVDASGTYTIDMTDPALADIDPYSYVVQVEDQRGLTVAVSSFSHYTCTLNWTSHYSALRNASDATIVVELLQNGTMRWLGQNLNLTTQTKPIPPIPVKAIHVNQTINGLNQEVPFQIEDWASDYIIPLGLTSNASIFGNRHMLVFLVNPNVSKAVIWWNGSDTATQTSFAYTNRYFNDNPSTGTLSNGLLTIQFASSGFEVTATRGSTTSTAKLMRINNRYDTTNPELAYVIYNGVVRSIVHGEPEYSSGITGCSNFYSHVVITLPANATYYTYQLRMIFLDSTERPRTITDLCPIQINALRMSSFGYTSSGSSYTTVNANTMYGSVFTSPSVAVFANSISFYGRSNSGTSNVKCLIVRHSDLRIIAVTNPVQVTTTAAWRTATFSSPPTLTPDTEYILMIIPDGTVRFYYIAGSTNQGHNDASNSYSSPTDPTDASHSNYQYSIYCNYTILQTENGTSSGYPIVSNESGLFYNSSAILWQHHWSQIISTSTQGVGIIFTDVANQMLYFFDSIAGTKTGALNVTSKAIELCPVTNMASVGFAYALDVVWCGAVVTFGETTPIYASGGGGLWIIAEYPPAIEVTTE